MSGGPGSPLGGMFGSVAAFAQDTSYTAQQALGMNPYANAYSTPKPKPIAVRTPDEIRAQLEARMAELEAQAAQGAVDAEFACRACKWADGALCTQPLVTGFSGPASQGSIRAELCGPEKALWEPRPTRWERLLAWLGYSGHTPTPNTGNTL